MKLSKTLEFLASLPYLGILSTVVANGVPIYVLSPTPSDIADDISASVSILGLKDYDVTHYRICLMSKPLNLDALLIICKGLSKIF